MNTNLFRPQHHQSKFSGCIFHVSHPSFCASMSPDRGEGDVNPAARHGDQG
jgi:hypothetical protein